MKASPYLETEGQGRGPDAPPTYLLARWLFLRGLGIVYLAAFVSLWVQIHGLVGSRGILPVRDFLGMVQENFGSKLYTVAPTLCWLDPSDWCLDLQCGAGAVLAGLLIIGVAPALVLFLLWALYLSLCVAGQVFMNYQWDALLLEAGLVSVFFAPVTPWPRLATEAPPALGSRWLMCWLLFRLMFASGIAKLASGDPTWRNLTAMHYHYETQPLPTWTSWYMFQAPDWFQRFSTAATLATELALPILIFGPRQARRITFAGLVALQVLIAATGNYGFFNLLAVVLCLPLLDDASFPARWQCWIGAIDPARRSRWRWPAAISAPVSACVVVITALPLLDTVEMALRELPAPWDRVGNASARVLDPVQKRLSPLRAALSALRSFNSYGLFAVMTTYRHEIIIEGADDGERWQAYEFRWKPGDPTRAPAFTGVHMPRLDWQMWFAALGAYPQNPWLTLFLERLLQGEPGVLRLLAHNPFPDQPPRAIRATLVDYRFTGRATRRDTGAWWRTERLGPYHPVMSGLSIVRAR
jgi:hypothetical protein